MKFHTPDCKRCGAPLEVWHRRKRVNCKFCGGVVIVEERKTRSTGEITNPEMTELDQSWRRSRRSITRRDSKGREIVPTVADAVIGGIGIGVFGVGMLGAGLTLFGIFIFLCAAGVTLAGLYSAKDYESQRRIFRRRRRRLMEKQKEERSAA